MIRESFRVETGIIFDAHMLRHDAGLDMNKEDIGPDDPAPNPCLPSGKHSALDPPTGARIEGFSFRHIPHAVYSGLKSGLTFPFQWVGGVVRSLRTREPSEPPHIPPKRRRHSEEEATEELKDVLSPIYDPMELQSWWKLFEYFPCKFSPITRPD